MNQTLASEEPIEPRNNREREVVSQQISVERFQGPLPHPAILEKYNQIVPGAAERIIKMAEEQSRHRRAIETKVIGADSWKSVLGIIFAFIIALLGLLIGGYTALKGQPFFGGTVTLATIASVVGTFIYGTQQRKRGKE